MKRTIRITVNRQLHELTVEPQETLLEVIREKLGLTGTKAGCHEGDCGSCTVILDGEPVNSCLVLAVQADGKDIVTIEGLETAQGPHPLQQAFVEKGAIQCGYCTPGMILSAKSLLDGNPRPTEENVRNAISGNLCRCTGYQKIVEAILSLSKRGS
jgi:aerobic carbon-monoxide dehydrogenase small subunit